LNLDNSKKLLEKSRELIPGLTQTFSRAATSFVEGVYPIYAQKAKGAHFWDVDGNEFLDYLMALGPITLGYNYKKVNDSVVTQLNEGILFSLPHPLELELSELLCDLIPNAEMVKFEKSGSNAVTGAVRAARAYTKRDKIAYCGSAGVWHDWQAIMVSRNEGVPKFNRELIKLFEYNDANGLEQIFKENPNEIAAVVVEPTHFDKPENDFLKIVRELSDKNGSLLILDEIVTGFRFDIQGGQKFFDFDGDLICFGKGMANGFPLSAITGKKEFMKIFEKLWVSSTNSSETLSLIASLTTITEMKKKETINYCWKLGKQLFDAWNQKVVSYGLDAKMIGYPVRMTLQCFDSDKKESVTLKALILQEMVKRGIFMSPGVSFISYSHIPNDIKNTIDALDDVCKLIQEKIKQNNFASLIEGNLPKTIWTMDMKPTKMNT